MTDGVHDGLKPIEGLGIYVPRPEGRGNCFFFCCCGKMKRIVLLSRGLLRYLAVMHVSETPRNDSNHRGVSTR